VDKFSTLNPFGRTPTASSALLTYEPYYGLREKPFSLSTADVTQPPPLPGEMPVDANAASTARQ